MRRFNNWLAENLTRAVATMACAWIFFSLALLALPSALGLDWLPQSTLTLVQWISQTFIQLVMLSVIMVGQKLQGQKHTEQHKERMQAHEKTHRLLEGK